jgi:hypothetical protein
MNGGNMKLLIKMKADLLALWRKAQTAESKEKRKALMEKYRKSYALYKKQTRFVQAINDGAPSSLRHQHQ